MYSLTIYSGTGAFELATLHVALSFISYCRMHLMGCMLGGSRTILTLTERHVGLYRLAKPRWLHHLRLRRNQMMTKQFNSIYESSHKSARRRF